MLGVMLPGALVDDRSTAHNKCRVGLGRGWYYWLEVLGDEEGPENCKAHYLCVEDRIHS